VSPRGLPRRTHIRWVRPQEREGSSGTIRRIYLVGKQSRSRNSNALNLTSLCWQLVRSASCLPNHANCPFSLLMRRVCLVPLKGPANTKSILLALRKRTAYAAVGPLRLNLLTLHELPSIASLKPLTKVVSTRYAGVQAGGLRCGDSAANASGSVPGALDNQGKEARS
jgi:hypothetical protein